MEYLLFHNVNLLDMCSICFKDIFENKKLSLYSSQWEGLLRPYQHYVMGR